jgi:O-antigen/teichoic acid export membrane protein
MVWGWTLGIQRPTFDKATIKSVVRYAFPVSISAMLGMATAYADQILLSKYLPAADFAVYSFCCLSVPPLLIFEFSVARVLIPRLSRAFVNNRTQTAMTMYRDAISELTWLLLPSTIGLIVFAKPIVVLLFTAKFVQGASYLKIYALTYLIMVLPYDSVARARADGDWILKRLTVFSSLSLLFVYILARRYGAMGALIGSVSSRFLLRATSILDIHLREKWPLSKMLPWRDWAQYAAVSAFGTFVAILTKRYVGGGKVWLFVGGGLFAVLYLASTYSTFRRRNRELQIL